MNKSATEPKEAETVEKPKLSDKTDSTLASSTAEPLSEEIQDASPDLTIAFLILLGLGISVFYNQTQ